MVTPHAELAPAELAAAELAAALPRTGPSAAGCPSSTSARTPSSCTAGGAGGRGSGKHALEGRSPPRAPAGLKSCRPCMRLASPSQLTYCTARHALPARAANLLQHLRQLLRSSPAAPCLPAPVPGAWPPPRTPCCPPPTACTAPRAAAPGWRPGRPSGRAPRPRQPPLALLPWRTMHLPVG